MAEHPGQIDQFLDLVFSYGPFWVYLVIFLACFIENLVPPFPGDSFIVAGGGLVAASRLDFIPAFLVVLAGGLTSVMILYLFGRNYGRDFFMRKNYKYFSAADIVKVEAYFRRWGTPILVSSRFVVGFRVALAVGAGISRYGTFRTFLYSLVSYVLFAGLLMYTAIKFVENYEVIEKWFKTYNMIIWPVLIILLAFYILRKIKNVRNKGL